MLMCKACNTRFAQGTLLCPSCGRRASEHSADAGSSGSSAIPLPPSRGPLANEPEDEIDLELDEEDVVKHAVAAEPGPRGAVPARQGTIDMDQVRSLLAEQPGLLEKGLGLHADDEGDPLGIDFPTPVGSIDLLGRDRKGGFVVVHVPARDEVSDSVSGMLRRMGWVRKHLAGPSDDVRGFVVVEQLPEDVAYAAAGAGGAIAFKAVRLALTFHDIE
jgi:RecB family endonuclease NucS